MAGIGRVTPDMGPCRGLSRRQAARWLRTDEGRAWARASGKRGEDLLDHVVAGSERKAARINRAATNKHEASNMDIMKTLRSLTEAEFTTAVTTAAKAKFPELSAARAFSKVFEDQGPEGVAVRRAWLIVKGVVPADSPEREYGLGNSRGISGGALSGREYAASDSEVEDDAEDDRFDALAALERLAERERRRDPSLSKAQSFTRVFVDPANVALAKAERRQAMKKLGVAV
jgi:hypothetical protein